MRIVRHIPPPVDRRVPIVDLPLNSYNPTVLTSFPNDQDTISIVNTALLVEVNFGNSLTTLARNYLGCLVRTSDRCHVANTIYHKDNTLMREALGRRKVAKSGKRHIVHGKNVMTTPEMHEAMV